jgi:GT2 family glycosyltransferase
MKNNLVSIIIVSWNGLHWLKKSLPSLLSVTYKPLEIILVDNSSTDGTGEWVKKHFPTIKILTVDQNLGYAEANNRGFELSTGEYVLFLNNDVEVTPSFVSQLVEVFKDSSVGGAQSKILLMDDRTRYDTIGAFLTSTGFLYHYCFVNKQQKKYDKKIDIFTPKGACMMFKRSMLDTILVNGKLFDPDAFAYFEETDMSHRIWLSGKRIIYVPSSVIYHKMGGTSTSMDNAYIQYHSFKNRIASYIKNLEVISLLQLLPVHIVCCELYALLYLLKGKFSVSVAIQRALVWNVVHLISNLRKRRYIQKRIRKISDEEYFKNVFRNPRLGFYIAQFRGIPFYE